MKKLLYPTITRIKHRFYDGQVGESYAGLLGYFYPEFVTSLLLYSLLSFIDSLFISQIATSPAYATLGITNTLFHLISKIAEGLPTGIIVLCGQYNGIGDYKQVGRVITDAFWTTVIMGACIVVLLYCGAYIIYAFFEVPQDIITLGVPFLRLRVLGVFFNFVYFALIGFMRGIKNTRTPMYLTSIGAVVFIVCDYVFIFGAFGAPRLELQGSALASVIQYCVMFAGALYYILANKQARVYSVQLFQAVRLSTVRILLGLSWPVMLDKAAFALSHMWLTKMVGSMAKLNLGVSATVLLSSFVAIKYIQGLLILPGVAFAHIITFLVSNDYRAQRWTAIKQTLRRVFGLSLCMMGTAGVLLLIKPNVIFSIIDRAGHFSSFALQVLPIITIIALFDLAQLLLSAALRGAANVRAVMWVRIVISAVFFVPVSYWCARLQLVNPAVQFALIYGSLYIGNALMALCYIVWFRTQAWKKQLIERV